MKKLTKQLKKSTVLLAGCYLLALAVWLVLGCWHWGADTAARAGGNLQQVELSVETFQLVEIDRTENGLYRTTGGDPQMILEYAPGVITKALNPATEEEAAHSKQVVRNLVVQVKYLENEPREMCLYYTTKVGEDYSQDRRVFPQVRQDGSYLYTLPRGNIVSLRFDPCSPDEGKPVAMQFGALVLNDRNAMPNYWLPSWYQCFCLLLYPGLAASAISWLLAAKNALFKKK